MLKDFIEKLKKLPKSNKSMIYLMWIYRIGEIIGSLFMNIYVFSLNKKILDVLQYNAVFFTSVFIWFSLVWLLFSAYRKNIKNMYYLAYSAYIIAFILLFIFNWYLWVYLFAVIFWVGCWMFWCAMHTQELVNIEDRTRDIYGSIAFFWVNIINIVVPIIISVIFFIVGKYFDFSAYIVLFLTLPIIYATSFLFIKDIWNYIPTKVEKKDIKNFFNFKKYWFGLLYFFSVWVHRCIIAFLFPVIVITLLKSEINVGLFEWFAWLVSAFLIIFTSSKRNIKNRTKIMWIFSVLLLFNLVIFALNFNIYGYIFYTLVSLILLPLYKISDYVFSLKLMATIKVKWKDFFSSMILREVILWISRMTTIIIFVFFVKLWISTENILKIGLICIWLFFILAWVNISLHMKYENNQN